MLDHQRLPSVSEGTTPGSIVGTSPGLDGSTQQKSNCCFSKQQQLGYCNCM